MKIIKYIVFSIVGFFVFCSILGIVLQFVIDTPYSKETETLRKTSSNANTKKLKEEEKTNWIRSEEVDKMSGSKDVYLSNVSLNKARFNFPYNGGSSMKLIIRKWRGKTDAMIRISKGQFNTCFQGCKLLVKFSHKKKPESYSMTTTSDHSGDVRFFRYPKALIKNLKLSKKTIIEAEFFQNGKIQFEFNTKDFKWP